jgi:hypothetical protein
MPPPKDKPKRSPPNSVRSCHNGDLFLNITENFIAVRLFKVGDQIAVANSAFPTDNVNQGNHAASKIRLTRIG